MSLIAVPVSPTLDVIAKVDEVDRDAAGFLVTLAMAETLGDLISKAGPSLVAELDQYEAEQGELWRRGVVRAYIAKRERGEDVGDLLEFAKADGELLPFDEDAHPRDQRGRWTKLKDAFDAFTAKPQNDPRGEAAAASLRRGKYDHLKAAGSAINSVAGGAHPVGAAAQFVGSVGPEAEKVLGPHVRRTAYRYRGTSRPPSKELQHSVEDASIGMAVSRQTGRSPAVNADRGQGQRTDRLTPAEGAVAAAQNLGAKGGTRGVDQGVLRARGDAAVAYFDGRIPDPALALLSEKSGKTPPSQGAIIDAQGKVTAEAVGYNGDHYLPFDLKNMSSLYGGQYVRTRGAGGPTTEDIYTGLVSGARQIQVVSNSGVFTVEFDPSLRGGNRYSDKARQMVERYGSMLEAISDSESKQLLVQDVPPEVKSQLRQEAARGARGNRETFRRLYEASLDKARFEASYADADEGDLHENAEADIHRELARSGRRATEQQMGRMVEDRVHELQSEQRKQQVRYYRLDGEGYDNALKALKQEFPYFIRDVRRQDRVEFAAGRGQARPEGARRDATDRSYVGDPGSKQQRGTGGADRGLGGKVRAQRTVEAPKPAAKPEDGGEGGTPSIEPAANGDQASGTTFDDVPVEPSMSLAAASKALQPQSVHQIDTLLKPVGELFLAKPPGQHAQNEIDGTYFQNGGVPNQSEPKIVASYDGRVIAAWLAAEGNGDVKAAGGPGQYLAKHPELATALASKMGDVREYAANFADASGRAAYSDQSFDTIEGALQSLDPQPFAPVAKNPMLYAPDEHAPKPQAFPQVVALGTDEDNYATALKHAPTEVLDAVHDFADRPLSTIADSLREESSAVTTALGALSERNGVPVVQPASLLNAMPAGFDDVEDAGEQLEDFREFGPESQLGRYLMGRQQAYALLVGAEKARRMTGSKPKGGGAPFDPAPATGPVRKRAPRSRVVVHAPDSAIAKAYRRRESARASR